LCDFGSSDPSVIDAGHRGIILSSLSCSEGGLAVDLSSDTFFHHRLFKLQTLVAVGFLLLQCFL